MKEEKCANYERDNVETETYTITADKYFHQEFKKLVNIDEPILSEMEQNVADFMDKDLENALKISREQLDRYIDEIYFNKPQREIFLMNADGILDNKKSKTDPIVESVRQKLLDRSAVGIKKYNTTLESNNKDNYLNHLQQELMDATLYVQKLMQQQIDITELVASESNDWELGKLIRKIYGKV